MSESEAIEQARAHVLARIESGGGEPPAITTARGPAGFTAVRAALPGAYPGTGVAVALVSPGGRVLGKGTQADLAELLDEIGFDPSPQGARILAELIALGWFDGMIAVLADPSPTVSTTTEGVRLEAVVRGALSRTPDRLTVIIPSVGPPTIERTAIPNPVEPTAINRATALERALASGDAMTLQRALRAMSGQLDDRELTVVARVALSAGGPIADQARRRLGEGPAAEQALARARTSLDS